MFLFLCLCCCLLIWRLIFLRNPPSQFLMNFYIFLYFFILFIFCISSKYIFLINFCFSVFLSSSVFILSLTLTLILFFVSPFHSLSLLVFLFVILFLSLSLSHLVCITVSHLMILLDLIWCIVWFDIVFDNMILCIRMYYYRVWYW